MRLKADAVGRTSSSSPAVVLSLAEVEKDNCERQDAVESEATGKGEGPIALKKTPRESCVKTLVEQGRRALTLVAATFG